MLILGNVASARPPSQARRTGVSRRLADDSACPPSQHRVVFAGIASEMLACCIACSMQPPSAFTVSLSRSIWRM
ncbi:MAG: hypothetical protein KGQ32_03735, partial [Xanthomonadaceae bacterium]|nr:hypothetical protein [Xanthomonadaceae bacterium]